MGNCFSGVVKLYISLNALTRLTIGGEIDHRYPSSGQYTCGTAGPSDTCIFHCTGTAGAGKTFYCGDAGICQFSCEDSKCAEGATIYGDDANTLTLSSSSSECLKGMTVTAPNSGDLIFDTMEAEKSYKEMEVNAGPNTQSIIIDCTYGAGDECKKMQINAQTAQYLEIRVGSSASELDGDEAKDGPVTINCPQNSDYNGPEEAPCIIDLSGDGSLIYANIYTTFGIPHDVWIKEGKGSISSTTLYCSYQSDSQSSSFTSTSGKCWNTREPTAAPTKTTNEPTLSPTPAPTFLPTFLPSIPPSKNPTTGSPTLNPSSTPTEGPIATDNPSITPSNNPTKSPTLTPSVNPIPAPTASDADADVDVDVDVSGTDDADADNDDDDTKDSNIAGITELSLTTLVAIGVICIILCCLCLCIIVFISKLRKHEDYDGAVDEHKVEMQQTNATFAKHKIKKDADRLMVKKFFENDLNLPNYYELFITNGYDSMKAVLAIKDKEELHEIGVSKPGHQNLILTEIATLRQTDGTHTTDIYNTHMTDEKVEGGAESYDTGYNENVGDGPLQSTFTGAAMNYGQDANAQMLYYQQAMQNMMQNYGNVNMQQNYGGNVQQNYGNYMGNMQQNNNNNNVPQNDLQFGANAAGFVMNLPPPPPEVKPSTGGADAQPGVGGLMNEMRMRQKQRIIGMANGEGSLGTEYIGTLETEDLFGSLASERYMQPYAHDTAK